MTALTAPRRLYLDSSALVALYYAEPHTTTIRAAIAARAVLASSYAAYPETRSGLARVRREKLISARDYHHTLADLELNWADFERLEVGAGVALVAGALAERHKLKGYDSVHLASALTFDRMPGGAAFLSYDARLNRAAQAEGLRLWTP